MFLKLTEVKTRQANHGALIVTSEAPIYLNMDRVTMIIPFTQQWEETKVITTYSVFEEPEKITTAIKSLSLTLVEIDGRQLQIKESIDYITTAMNVKEETNNEKF